MGSLATLGRGGFGWVAAEAGLLGCAEPGIAAALSPDEVFMHMHWTALVFDRRPDLPPVPEPPRPRSPPPALLSGGDPWGRATADADAWQGGRGDAGFGDGGGGLSWDGLGESGWSFGDGGWAPAGALPGASFPRGRGAGLAASGPLPQVSLSAAAVRPPPPSVDTLFEEDMAAALAASLHTQAPR